MSADQILVLEQGAVVRHRHARGTARTLRHLRRSLASAAPVILTAPGRIASRQSRPDPCLHDDAPADRSSASSNRRPRRSARRRSRPGRRDRPCFVLAAFLASAARARGGDPARPRRHQHRRARSSHSRRQRRVRRSTRRSSRPSMCAKASGSRPGQLLATLDPDLRRRRCRAAQERRSPSLDAQIARDEAELAGKPLTFPDDHGPRAAEVSGACSRRSTINARRNTREQSQQLTIRKIEADSRRRSPSCRPMRRPTEPREDRARNRADAHDAGRQRHRLAAQHAGLAGLAAGNRRAAPRGTHNSLVESQHQLQATKSEPRRLHPAMAGPR